MFGLFKKDNMLSALKSCQHHIRGDNLDLEMTDEQINIVSDLSRFKEIESGYKSRGYTAWGGLALFFSQFIAGNLKAVEDGRKLKEITTELAGKFAHIALLIANSVPELKLTKTDMGPIQSAADFALQWIDKMQIGEEI